MSSTERGGGQLKRVALLLGIVVFVLWAFTPLATSWFAKTPESAGETGDQFGSINALFSGLAFTGVVIAILLQREELQEQRRVLKLQQEDLARSVEAQQKSEEALRKRVELEAMLARKRFTLALYDEWHGDELHSSRIHVDRRLDAWRQGGDRVPSLSDVEGWGKGDTSRSIFKIIHFLEKWALLEEADQIDGELLARLLGSYALWWEKELLVPSSQADEANEDFIRLHKMISTYVFRYRDRMTGSLA